MELWDLLDRHGNPQGRTHVRGRPLPEDSWHRVVHVWIVGSDGRLLIQKRSDETEFEPGTWAATGGSLLAGETSEQACFRETREELGLELDPSETRRVLTYRSENSFVDVWLARQDADLSRLVLQPEEVARAEWLSLDEIRAMIRAGHFWNYRYLEQLETWIRGGDK